VFWQLICIGQIRKHKNQPTFQKTQLGWVIGGKLPAEIFAKSRLCGVSLNEQINQNLAKFWEMIISSPKRHLILKKEPA